MEIAIHPKYGAFFLTEEWEQQIVKWGYHSWELDYRTDPRFVAAVRAAKRTGDTELQKLRIIEIPDTATSWLLEEYDGLEIVYYCVNGIIYKKG